MLQCCILSEPRPAKEARDPSAIINQLRGTVAGDSEVITSADVMAALRGAISMYHQLTAPAGGQLASAPLRPGATGGRSRSRRD
jgi:hypothetical protein